MIRSGQQGRRRWRCWTAARTAALRCRRGRMTALGNLQCAYHVRAFPVTHLLQCWPVVGVGFASYWRRVSRAL